MLAYDGWMKMMIDLLANACIKLWSVSTQKPSSWKRRYWEYFQSVSFHLLKKYLRFHFLISLSIVICVIKAIFMMMITTFERIMMMIDIIITTFKRMMIITTFGGILITNIFEGVMIITTFDRMW